MYITARKKDNSATGKMFSISVCRMPYGVRAAEGRLGPPVEMVGYYEEPALGVVVVFNAVQACRVAVDGNDNLSK
jgi:hypothetical protein